MPILRYFLSSFLRHRFKYLKCFTKGALSGKGEAFRALFLASLLALAPLFCRGLAGVFRFTIIARLFIFVLSFRSFLLLLLLICIGLFLLNHLCRAAAWIYIDTSFA